MRRTQTSMLAMLVAGMLLALTPLPAVAARPSSPARYLRSAMDRDELAMLPQALGKVTKAGKVGGTINAAVGDIVLPASAAVPDEYAGAAPTAAGARSTARSSLATAAATTVLHAGRLVVTPAGSTSTGVPARIRTYFAMEENTSNQARGYFKARLVYGTTTDYTWSTYHQASAFRVHYADQDNSSADGCWAYSNLRHCTWTKDPSDCRGPNPTCDAYLVVGTYRPKGNSPDWWVTEVQLYKFWHPYENRWVGVASCTDSWMQGYQWNVGNNSGTIPPDCPLIPGVTP